jgi:hypothetical protein
MMQCKCADVVLGCVYVCLLVLDIDASPAFHTGADKELRAHFCTPSQTYLCVLYEVYVRRVVPYNAAVELMLLHRAPVAVAIFLVVCAQLL